MSEYEQSATVQAAPDSVFAYVAAIEHLPEYLPTTRSAAPEGGDRVRIQGDVRGHPYDADGYYRVDQQAQRVEWGSDGEQKYGGWLQVAQTPDGDCSAVTIHLSFDPQPAYAHELDTATGSSGDRQRAIVQVLDAALDSIRNRCEGQQSGGKVEPPIVH